MTASKKFDTSKLTLGVKKEINKEALAKPANKLADTVVEQIHNMSAENNREGVEKPVREVQENTKRTTLDIPEGLHKQIKRRLVDKEQTIKDYFLELVKKDLGIE